MVAQLEINRFLNAFEFFSTC